MTFNISLICLVTFILIIWFDSDIIQTIAKIFRIEKFLKTKEFIQYKVDIDVLADYPDFLYSKFPGYSTKLISCPICLCFWLTILTSNLYVFTCDMPQWYFIMILPINYVFSLLSYLIIRKLL